MRVSREEVTKALGRAVSLEDILAHVKPIIDEVRAGGDEALFRFTREFDGVDIRDLEVDREELMRLAESVSSEVAEAIDASIESVEALNSKLMPRDVEDYYGGLRRIVRWVPIDKVGIYVPRGYFSTLIMTGVLAKIAGVREIVVTTPPMRDCSIRPEIAYVALKLNARVFRVGGPQAVAALAFGTDTVPRVSKVVGPGNAYVQAAKLLVSAYVGIDGVEGPTELVTCVGRGVDPEVVAMDLAAQLEHSSAIGLLASWDEGVLARVEDALTKLTNSPYLSTLVRGPEDCVDLINEVSPEHVSIWGEEVPVDRIRNAGAVSVLTPSALIDYVAGPSHVLPTGGSAAWRGVLTPLDFLRPVAYVRATDPTEARLLAGFGASLGRWEGFKMHAGSIEAWVGWLGGRGQ